MEESGLPGDKAGVRSVYKIMDVSILKLCWWGLEEEACLPNPSPSPEGDLVVVPHYLFIKQGNEGFWGFLRFFSYPRSAFTSYWDVCFHFKVNFWNFFSFGVDLKGFWSPSGKARQNLKHFHWDPPTFSSSKSLECLQKMLFLQYEGDWWPWEFLSFSLEFWGWVIIILMHCKTLLSGLGWFFAWKNRLCSFQISEEPF